MKKGTKEGNIWFNQDGSVNNYGGSLTDMIEKGTVEKIYAKIKGGPNNNAFASVTVSNDGIGKLSKFKKFNSLDNTLKARMLNEILLAAANAHFHKVRY